MKDSVTQNELIVIPQNSASPFEAIRHTDGNGREYWTARELMEKLGYVKWQHFEEAMGRARISCEVAQGVVSDHFADAGKMIATGKGAKRNVVDYHLTRYACYLIAMNGDPRKTEIAEAQAYFVRKTREAELLASGPNHAISDRLAATYECLEPRIPDGYWSVITEIYREVCMAEVLGHLDGGAFPETSVGSMWAKYARFDLHIDVDHLPKYQHYDPRSKWKREFPALMYPLSLQRTFRRWFRDVYLPHDCPVYVAGRQKRLAYQQRKIAGMAAKKRLS